MRLPSHHRYPPEAEAPWAAVDDLLPGLLGEEGQP